MANIREKPCLSVLSASALADYTLNPYTGCLHGCVYCYARFMRRFSGHQEPWGQFLDVMNILTKSALILRDLDLLRGYPHALVGFTIIDK
ncbi:MAG: hypothetical protein HY998_02825 [candidate division NC10 bacterium]|nr:hypothetical protein [candidate division NC10 bacterium]